MSVKGSIRSMSALLSIGFALLLAGCSIESNMRPAVVERSSAGIGDGFLSVVVGPGEGANCRNSSCRIYYRMPDLGGKARVVVNNFLVGTFPSGQLVDLGSWSDSARISIPDADVPMAYVDMYGNSAQ